MKFRFCLPVLLAAGCIGGNKPDWITMEGNLRAALDVSTVVDELGAHTELRGSVWRQDGNGGEVQNIDDASFTVTTAAGSYSLTLRESRSTGGESLEYALDLQSSFDRYEIDVEHDRDHFKGPFDMPRVQAHPFPSRASFGKPLTVQWLPQSSERTMHAYVIANAGSFSSPQPSLFDLGEVERDDGQLVVPDTAFPTPGPYQTSFTRYSNATFTYVANRTSSVGKEGSSTGVTWGFAGWRGTVTSRAAILVE